MNEIKQILLQHRRDGDWGLPGGLMEPGESLEDTARREVREESGLKLNKLSLLDVFSGPELYLKLKNGDELYSVTTLYLCNDFSGDLIPDQMESFEVRFFNINSLPKLNPANRIYIDRYIKLSD
jgi:8-oxo-dGTP pyrophosphatase MutT (NUDIX family)